MKRDPLELDFEMTVKKRQANNSPPHRNRYFEIMKVLNGHGKHIINGNQFEYANGDLFLLTPQDLHTFKIAVPSEFYIIDFTSSFLTLIGNQNKNQNQSAQ